MNVLALPHVREAILAYAGNLPPNGGKGGYNNGKRKYKKKRNRKGNKRLPKLLDKKINTALEVRMQQIAEKEVAQNRVHLCLRENPQGTYVPATNTFTVRDEINFSGEITEIGLVPKAPLEDISLQSKRTTNLIKITGFSIDLNVGMNENASQPKIRNSTLSYALVKVYDDWSEDPGAITVDEGLKWKTFGFSSLLDSNDITEISTRKISNIIKGSCNLRAHDAYPINKSVSKYVKLKNPITMEYQNEDDVSGITDPLKYRFYWVVRSNIPDANDKEIFPTLVSSIKMYYYQP